MRAADFQRARHPEQKEQRRLSILAAAREMLDEAGPEDLSLNKLARRAGLAKSNVYRYFESREEVLMHVLQSDLDDFLSDLESRLGGLRGKSRTDRFVEHIVKSVSDRPRLCQLVSVLSSVLEQNLSAEGVRSFKRATLGRVQRTILAAHDAVPELSISQHLEVMRYAFALLVGLWAATHPGPTVERVLAEDPELAAMHNGFETDFERGLKLVVRGLLHDPGSRPRRTK